MGESTPLEVEAVVECVTEEPCEERDEEAGSRQRGTDVAGYSRNGAASERARVSLVPPTHAGREFRR